MYGWAIISSETSSSVGFSHSFIIFTKKIMHTDYLNISKAIEVDKKYTHKKWGC